MSTKLTYTYKEANGCTKTNPNGSEGETCIWDDVLKLLNALETENERSSVKIAMSNISNSSELRTNPCRAVIYYTTDDAPTPRDTSLTGTWDWSDNKADTDYDKMYDECLDSLNELSWDRSYNARISMTNAGSHTSHLMLWCREEG
ncbi:MAG TPA: hypothetical protein DCE42_26260 [Myxococcales bacterium]|nr:hypothetical protein [Deltaproteobacteria bacterium]MBU52997.1 hypothetical protein [Deltaproteobacteria bacterium]HAA58294.1 hypothetical protein [Myxococcales bacterium]|tara:strand:+ start:17532 stop:17969 length:438 start_codon:yes stop_codon:yes gene_type:complete